MKRIKKIGLVQQVVIAFVAAIVAGVIFGPNMEVVKPLGDLFLRLIKFIIVPLILSTLVVGIASTGSVEKLTRIGGKTITYFLATTLIAVSIGLVAGFLFSPGIVESEIKPIGEVPANPETGGFVAVLLDIIPTNPIAGLVEGNILQIIFFAIFLGLGITLVGEKAQPVYQFFEGFAEIMYKITGIVMKTVPLGIFGLLSPLIGLQGVSILLPLLKLLLAVAVACIIHAAVVYSLSVKYLGKMSPLQFFKGISPAMLVAFSTQSSSGTLPITMKNSEENLGVSKEVSSFILPLGATINMDGQAIYIGVACLFTAQFYGIDLSFAQVLMIALIATLGSIGTAGVPGAGLIMLTIALSSVNLPLEAIALVAGIDRFLNMFTTATNVTGDVTAAVYINASEKKRLEAASVREKANALQLDV